MVDITGDNTASEIGNYTAYVTPKAGHAWSGGTTDQKTVNWSINKIDINPTVSLNDWISTKPSAAGTHSVKATIAETTHYSSGTATADFTIEQREVGLTWGGGTSFTYDGQPHCPTAIATGLVGTDNCNVTVTGEQTDAGNDYTATASSLSNSNYKLPSTGITQTFTISKAANPLIYTDAQSVTKSFSTSEQTAELTAATDGQGTVSYAIQSQKQDTTDVNYFSLSGTILTIAAHTPVNTYTVVVRASATGTANYESSTKDSAVTVTIGRKSISPSVTMTGWTYGDTSNDPSVSGNDGNGTVTYKYKVSTADDSTYT